MKVKYSIDKEKAILAGKDRHGISIVDVPMDALTDRQRQVLATALNLGSYGGDGDGADVTLIRYTHLSTFDAAVHAAAESAVEATPEACIALIDRIADAVDTYSERERKRKEERENQAHVDDRKQFLENEDELNELESLSLDALVEKTTFDDRGILYMLHRSSYPTTVLTQSNLDPSLSPRCRRLNSALRAEIDRRNAIARQAAELTKQQEIAERNSWVAEHGSARLKRCLAEGIEHCAIYRDERIAIERPGWQWCGDVQGSYADPRNPSDAAFELLDRARSVDPGAKLVYWTVEHKHTDDCTDDCPKYDRAEYACATEYLGRTIVLFA